MPGEEDRGPENLDGGLGSEQSDPLLDELQAEMDDGPETGSETVASEGAAPRLKGGAASPGDEERAAKPEEEPAEEPEAKPLPPPTPEELAGLRRKAAERDEFLELAKRAKADFVNYRKRVDEERKRWEVMAQRDLLARLLAACDQCGLAAKSADGDSSVESLRDAIRLVWSELEKFLKETGVSPVPTAGARFDPELHEAVFVQPSSEHPDSTVVDEVKPGYLFGGQVLRPAQVVVAKRPAGEDAAADGEKGEVELENGRDDQHSSGDER